jgi:esterase
MSKSLDLHSIVLGEDNAKSVLVLHGILGSCQNWRYFCQRLFRMRESLRFVMVDLRNHGRSPHFDQQNGLYECAQDLFHLQKKWGAFDAIMGHSFGGKVALQCADGIFDERLKEVWVLDSNPSKEESISKDTSEAAQVISVLQKVELPIAKRQDLVETLLGFGVSNSTARWMTTNLKRTNKGYIWKFNLNAIVSMIEDYFQQDLWHVLEKTDRKYHIVRAMRSDRWSTKNILRLQGLPNGHHQIDAGHWIHVDNPDGLLQILKGNLLI